MVQYSIIKVLFKDYLFERLFILYLFLLQPNTICYTYSELYAKYQTISLKNYPRLGHKARRLGAHLFSVFWDKIFTKIIRVRYRASHRDSQVALEVKNPRASVEDVRDAG